MRTLVVAIAIFGLVAAPAKAADDSPSKDDKSSSIVGKLPDTEDNLYHVYLFTLKKNGISLRVNGDDFCGAMGYGAVVIHWEPVKDGEATKSSKPVDEKCITREKDGEVVKFCESVKDGEVARTMVRIKDGKAMKYKAVVFASRSKVTENQVEVSGDLDWVFCRAKISKSRE
jgi:hypothetical protein